MEVDFDFSDDKIELFLKAKLEEVRLRKESLQEVVLKRKEVKHSQSLNNPNIHINENVWKKIHNNKYCLCYAVFNNGANAIQDVKVLLWQNINEDFTYKIELFGDCELEECQQPENCLHVMNSIKKTTSFKTEAYVIVVFDIPNFFHKLDLIISGSLTFKTDSEEYELKLPDVYISPSDFNCTFYQIIDDMKYLLTMQCCSNEDNLVLIVPEEWEDSISNIFEFHCSFMNIYAGSSCVNYFVSYNISKLFDNSLIRVHKIEGNRYFLKVYTNNNNQLSALLHHIYKSISNIVILPLIYYNRYLCKNAVFSNDLLQEFRKALSKEMELTYKYVQQCEALKKEEVLSLQKIIYESEQCTDELFLKLSNVKY